MLIQNKYKIIDKIGSGGFSNIYMAKNVNRDNYVAIKFDYDEASKKLLFNEINVYLDLLKNDATKFINIKSFGIYEKKNYIIMDFIPNTIETYIEKNMHISPERLLHNLIITIKHLHKYEYVHRDIKPENILVKRNKLLLIDLGFATKRTKKKYNNFIGNKLFSSYNVHSKNYEYRKKDDIISCFFLIFYLYSDKTLPWKDKLSSLNDTEMYHIKKYSNFFEFYKNYNLSRIITHYKNFIKG